MGKQYSFVLIVFLFNCFFSLQLSSQVKVPGVLKDAEENFPLSYANVTLLAGIDSVFITGATTDENGKFQIISPDTGYYLLRISYLGYGTQLVVLKISTDEQKNLGEILMQKSGENLAEVLIEGRRPIYSYDGEKKYIMSLKVRVCKVELPTMPCKMHLVYMLTWKEISHCVEFQV